MELQQETLPQLFQFLLSLFSRLLHRDAATETGGVPGEGRECVIDVLDVEDSVEFSLDLAIAIGKHVGRDDREEEDEDESEWVSPGGEEVLGEEAGGEACTAVEWEPADEDKEDDENVEFCRLSLLPVDELAGVRDSVPDASEIVPESCLTRRWRKFDRVLFLKQMLRTVNCGASI